MADKRPKHKTSYDIADELGIPALTPSQFIKHVRHCVKVGKPVFVQSRPGIGKTTMVHDLMEQIGYVLHVERFNGKDPTDMAFPYVFKDEATGVMHHAFTTPTWFKSSKDTLPEGYRGVCIFGDEFAQAVPSMQNKMGEIMDGSLSNLPTYPNTIVILAANFAQDKAATYPVPRQIANRASCVVLAPDLDDTQRYISTHNIRPEIGAFVKLFPDSLDSYEADSTINFTPRSVCSLSPLMDQNPAIDEELPLYSSIIGRGWGSQFTGFLRIYRDLPKLEHIINNPKREAIPDEDQTDVLCALSAMLGRAMSVKNAAPIVEYLVRLPAEFCVFALRDAVRRDAELKKVRALTQWCVQHGDVLS